MKYLKTSAILFLLHLQTLSLQNRGGGGGGGVLENMVEPQNKKKWAMFFLNFKKNKKPIKNPKKH
jgi:hypothetical protein